MVIGGVRKREKEGVKKATVAGGRAGGEVGNEAIGVREAGLDEEGGERR